MMRLRSPFSARSFFRDPVGYTEREARGDMMSLAAGPVRFAVVRSAAEAWRILVTESPDYEAGRWKQRARRFVGDTLFTLGAPEHKRRRTALQPVLSRTRIERLTPQIVTRIERLQQHWQEGSEFAARRALAPLSLAIAGDVLLSEDFDPVAADLSADLTAIVTAIPRLLPPLPFTRLARALQRVVDRVDALVRHRREQPPGTAEPDVLDALLALNLPNPVIRGEVMTSLLAAADEPPIAVAAAWYLLSRNPTADQRFYEDLDTVGTSPAARLDDRPGSFVDAVVSETLRLCPPTRHIDRRAVRDVMIDSRRVCARANVVVSPLVLHHDPRVFDDPRTFRPERWLLTRESPLPRGAYLPFGAGAHRCLGEALATAIVRLILVTIGRRWRVRVADGAVAPTPGAPGLVVRLEAR